MSGSLFDDDLTRVLTKKRELSLRFLDDDFLDDDFLDDDSLGFHHSTHDPTP